jgi:hypothetical protein
MIQDEFIHTIEDGTRIKFTIHSKFVGGIEYYYAKLINIDLDVYRNLSELEQRSSYGIDMKQGTNSTIYSTDLERLKNDIINHYGTTTMIHSEI